MLLTCTRWLPVGLVVGIMVLFQLDRGQSVAQALTASAVSGLVVFLLELPTSSFADGFGRRPVYLAAAAVNVVTAFVYLAADAFWLFVLGAGLMGVFRALDSGPLEAWYVDTVHLTTPGADVDGPLARQGAVVGGSLAVGAVLSGGLVAWDPLPAVAALTLPMAVFAGLNVLHLLAVLALLREPVGVGTAPRSVRRAVAAARAAPRIVREGLRLLRGNRILRGLVGVGAVVMGLVAGPVALVAAYLATDALHGGAGPVHGALLHREASAGNRATLLSMNSMASFAAFFVAAPLLGLLATSASTQVAMVLAGGLSVLGALCYLPARRHEREIVTSRSARRQPAARSRGGPGPGGRWRPCRRWRARRW